VSLHSCSAFAVWSGMRPPGHTGIVSGLQPSEVRIWSCIVVGGRGCRQQESAATAGQAQNKWQGGHCRDLYVWSTSATQL